MVLLNKKKSAQTQNIYSFLWNKERKSGRLPASHHYDKLEGVAPFSIVRGKLGLEGGCGNGYDLRILASKYPDVDFVGVDISDGIYNAKNNCEGLKNVFLIKASLTELPFKRGVFDFAYSYGVIHHTPSPRNCFNELQRMLSAGSKLIVYLYEKHEDRPFKRCALVLVKLIRLISTKLPKKLLYVLCAFFSPFVYILFSLPAKFFSRFSATKKIGEGIPFNFATGPFSLTRDLYDRFGAPIEYRYNERETRDLFEKALFRDIGTAKIKDTAGWVAWGTAGSEGAGK